ncbi:shikimate kinase, partial [Nocardia abscessus]|uniref:shikimate kinase n=1 Tax=Nocardia abscessus TaxID=120957 RepID=UPI002453D341
MIVQTDPRAPRVVLVGPPGAGKSTIGRKLARELGVELYDTDAGIERETGRTIPEIFAEDGEPEFRRIEERVVGGGGGAPPRAGGGRRGGRGGGGRRRPRAGPTPGELLKIALAACSGLSADFPLSRKLGDNFDAT